MYYTLDSDGNPVLEKDVIKWAKWERETPRTLKSDWVGDTLISTVFLGMNLNPGSGEPILWETLILDHPTIHNYTDYYSTRRAALIGHAKALQYVLEHS